MADRPTKSESKSSEAQFEDLLTYLNNTRGFDFTGYKRNSLMRRVDKRIEMVGVKGYANYQD